MTLAAEAESMEINDINESNGNMVRDGEHGFNLFPVSPEECGEGLPYAPIDFPEPGDIWSWKVGRRLALNGHYMDRYLYLPRRLGKPNHDVPTRVRNGFASKLSVKRYLQTAYPNADISSFFASFSWRIPSKLINGAVTDSYNPEHAEETGHTMTGARSDCMSCKAGNENCTSIPANTENAFATLPCEICCSEPHFCRDCCCILCSRTISVDYGGYSYFKCEAAGNDGYICGHVAHLNCALQSYVAGTIRGSIGLDAEYYCRRCDSRTDLVSHVRKLFQTCRSVDSPDDIDKILSLGVCILRGSEKTSARELLNSIESVVRKLKSGTCVGDIWKVGENTSAICTGVSLEQELANHQESPNSEPQSLLMLSTSSDYWNEYLKLEEEIEDVLRELRRSQETEFEIAKETLYSQKGFIHSLYQQLDEERSQLSRQASGTGQDGFLLNAVLDRVDQIKREVFKLKEMEKVAAGFGSIPKGVLRQHFPLMTRD